MPTLDELGLRGFEAVSWHMIVAPAGTPKPIVDRLHREFKAIVARPEFEQQVGKMGLLRIDSAPPDELPSATRFANLPDVPPIAEAGVPGFNAVAWLMVVAPAGTPKPIVDKLHGALKSIAAAPDMQRRLLDLGNIPLTSPPPAELGTYVKSEIGRWGKVVEQAGIAGSE